MIKKFNKISLRYFTLFSSWVINILLITPPQSQEEYYSVILEEKDLYAGEDIAPLIN